MDQNTNELAVKAVITQWAKAVRERDFPNILANYSKNIIMYDVVEPFKIIGIEAYRETWLPFFANSKPGVFNIKELKIVTSNQVAFCIAEMYCEDKVSDSYKPLDFRLTVGLEKLQGQWIILHEHHSVTNN